MDRKELWFDSSNGEHKIKALIWHPKTKPLAVLQIAHGMNEYSERYEEFALDMAGRGLIVCINDHAGHGDSIKETRGYFGAKDGYLHMIADMRTLMSQVKKEAEPQVPYFLLGHSMGSFLARYFSTMYGSELKGAIYSGTGNAPPALAFGILLAKVLKKFCGGTYSGGIIAKMSTGRYNNRFKDDKTGSGWLTRDVEKINEFKNEPRSRFTFTVSGYLDMFQALAFVSRPDWAGKLPKNLPILLISGDEDPLGECGKGVKIINQRLVDACCADVTMKLYEGGRHEMLNEINRDEVFQDIFEWISKRC